MRALVGVVVVVAVVGVVEGLDLLEAWLGRFRSSRERGAPSPPTAGYVLQPARMVTPSDYSSGDDVYDYDYSSQYYYYNNGDEEESLGYSSSYYYNSGGGSSNHDYSLQDLDGSSDAANISTTIAYDNTPKYPYNLTSNYETSHNTTYNNYYNHLQYFYSKYKFAVNNSNIHEHLPKSHNSIGSYKSSSKSPPTKYETTSNHTTSRQYLPENYNASQNHDVGRKVYVGQSDDSPHPAYDSPHAAYDSPHQAYDSPHPAYDSPQAAYDSPHPAYYRYSAHVEVFEDLLLSGKVNINCYTS